MKINRKIVMGVSAVLLPLGLVTAVGSTTVWAKGKPPQPGSVTCTSITGTIKFSPALTTNGGASSDKVTSSTVATGCTGSGGGASPTKGTTKITYAETTNQCSAVLEGTPKPETFTTKWSPSSIAPSIVSFPPATATQNPITLSFGGAGTTGTGSYTSADNGAASTAKIDIEGTVTSLQAECASKKGLKELVVDGGTSTVK